MLYHSNSPASNGASRMLITGGAGFIGSHLAEALLKQGHRVTVVDNISTGSMENVAHLMENPAFRLVVDTITNQDVMEELVSESDTVFHMAAAVGVELIIRNPVHVIETNVLGTNSVLSAASRQGKKVLIASTSEIYGKSTQVPFREDDDRLLGPTTRPRWSYSASKAVDEFLGLAYQRQMGLPVVIFRLFNTVGPRQTGQYGMVVPRFVRQALRGEPLTVYDDGQQSRCFCDVRDTVRAIVALSQCPEAVGQVFNIGSTNETTILELARRVVSKCAEMDGGANGKGASESIVFIPYDQAYELDFEDMRRRMPDTTKIRELVGWEPELPLDQTLEDIIQSFISADRATVGQ